MALYKNYIPLGILVVLVVFSIFVIKPFGLAIFIGALLAYMSSPLYQILQKKFKNKTIPALIVCLVVLLVFGILSGLFVNTLVRESFSLFALGKQRLATGLFTGCENSFCQTLHEFGRDQDVQYHIQQTLKAVTNWVINKGSNFLINIPRMLLNVFVVFFTMFYFLRDGNKIIAKLNDFLSMNKKKYSFVIHRMKEILHGVVYGYLIVAFIQGALGALGFFIFGVPSPLFWGVVMGLAALIPFLGTWLVWLPASLIIFLDGMFQDSTSLILKGIGLFAYSLIFVSTIDNFLRPKMMGEKTKTHPAIIMLGIFGGILVFGSVGVILGPIILALTFVFLDIYIKKQAE
ncbi:hypothetical protein COV17_02890 [Candidatus Woesearchaeota archaeon CG10_big_fil_rev_8_21_14_0_10_36_11]|nr:MAG: hypothetical protein COV17_02890 [Candidatus Woesearchaeota archaeon CG10_big_fil_rev_8_21_14_0_10_36_11]